MRNLLFVVIVFVCLVFGWIFFNHYFDSGWIFLLSISATALLSYLVCDLFFQDEKKVIADQLDLNTKELQLHKNELDILKTQAVLSTPHSELADLQKRFDISENDRNDLKGTLESQALTISALNKQIEARKQTIATLTPHIVETVQQKLEDTPHVATDFAVGTLATLGVSELVHHEVVSTLIAEEHHEVATPTLELPVLHEVVTSPTAGEHHEIVIPTLELPVSHEVVTSPTAGEHHEIATPTLELPILHKDVATPIVEAHQEIDTKIFSLDPTNHTGIEPTHKVTEPTIFLSESAAPIGAEFIRTHLKSEDDDIKTEHTPSNVIDLEVTHKPEIASIFTSLNGIKNSELVTETHIAEIPPVDKAVPQSAELPPMDDLKIIEGIGPRLELILYNGGIRTFKELAETRVDKIKEIMIAAGKNPNFNDPSTWPEQARLLANGEMEKFKAYTKWLDGGKIPGID